MSGWIKIHRKIEGHWLYKNSKHLHWWIDILLSANYEKRKFLIKGKLIECNAGETVNSLETWAKRWGVDKTVTRRFLKLLENDSMIVLKNETVTTRITICNYESYQSIGNADETQVKRTRNASETHLTPTKEDKEDKEIEEYNNSKFSFKNSLLNFGADKELAEAWMAVRKTKKATNSEQAFKLFYSEVQKSGLNIDQVLEICIKKDWKGFDAKWVKDFNNNKDEYSKQIQQHGLSLGLSVLGIENHNGGDNNSLRIGNDTTTG